MIGMGTHTSQGGGPERYFLASYVSAVPAEADGCLI